MYREDRVFLTPPQEDSIRSFVYFAWLPVRYVIESDGEQRSHWFWWEHYEVLERYRKLYCWKIGYRTFYEWFMNAWCLETVRPITKEEYHERKRNQ